MTAYYPSDAHQARTARLLATALSGTLATGHKGEGGQKSASGVASADPQREEPSSSKGVLYQGLPGRVHDGELEEVLSLPRKASRPQRPQEYVAGLLERIVEPTVLSADKAEELVQSKVKDKVVLLDNPQRDSFSLRDAKQKKAKQHASRRPRGLGRAALKDAGALCLEGVKHASLQPLQQAWAAYALDLLQPCIVGGSLPTTLDRAAMDLVLMCDYQGGELEVIRAKCPTLVGKRGIVLRETAGTFQLVGSDDRLVTVPKVRGDARSQDSLSLSL